MIMAKTQEGSGQYISHTIYTRNTFSRFSTTFCIRECSNSSVESIILIMVRKLVVDIFAKVVNRDRDRDIL